MPNIIKYYIKFVVNDYSRFWDELVSQSPRSRKIVKVFKLYVSKMDKAGHAYR